MGTVVQACATLHNLIVEARKNFYARDGAGGMREQNEGRIDFSFSVQRLSAHETTDMFVQLTCCAAAEETKDRRQQNELTAALVSHINEGEEFV
jgi:hypothetical protein